MSSPLSTYKQFHLPSSLPASSPGNNVGDLEKLSHLPKVPELLRAGAGFDTRFVWVPTSNHFIPFQLIHKQWVHLASFTLPRRVWIFTGIYKDRSFFGTPKKECGISSSTEPWESPCHCQIGIPPMAQFLWQNGWQPHFTVMMGLEAGCASKSSDLGQDIETSPSHSFPICKRGIIIVPIS